MKSQATDYVHWLGIRMEPSRALLFEAYKKRNADQCTKWREKWPHIAQLYPIYWETERQRWVWCPIHHKDIVEYVKLCEGVLRWRIKSSGG